MSWKKAYHLSDEQIRREFATILNQYIAGDVYSATSVLTRKLASGDIEIIFTYDGKSVDVVATPSNLAECLNLFSENFVLPAVRYFVPHACGYWDFSNPLGIGRWRHTLPNNDDRGFAIESLAYVA